MESLCKAFAQPKNLGLVLICGFTRMYFRFNSLQFPHTLNLPILASHSGHHFPIPEAKPMGGKIIGKKRKNNRKKNKAHLNITARFT